MTPTTFTEARAAAPPADRPADPRMEAVMAWLQTAYAKPAFGVHGCTTTNAAGVAGLSPFHFCRVFKAYYGRTFLAAKAAVQVAAAQALIRRGMALDRVATAVGFAHQSHFTGRFKQVTGLTPGRWRRADVAADVLDARERGDGE